MKKVIDLTHLLENGMPVFPGTEEPTFEVAATHEQNGYKETRMNMLSHVGTHMDAPAHIFAGRTTLDQFPPDQFLGMAVVIDCSELSEGEEITMELIERYGDLAERADFLLFRTGWDKKWGTEAYLGDYPCVNQEVLEYILRGNYKGIGFDVIGLDPVNDMNLTRHKMLFQQKDLVNIENLKNLELCGDGLFRFGCFPLNLKDADGAPIRAMAWLE